MKQVDVSEAGSHLAELMAEVQRGEDIVLTRQGQPIGRLVPLGPSPGQPVPPDPKAILDSLFQLRDQLATRGVSFSSEEIRAVRDGHHG